MRSDTSLFSADSLLPYQDLVSRMRAERSTRLGRTTLQADDFDALANAGYLTMSVPTAMHGRWESLHQTGPALAEVIRFIARGDSSVALVAAMHPAVIAYWHPTQELAQSSALGDEARRAFATALDGHWWGTMMSEPGSGGDVSKTKAVATAAGAGFRLNGEKHFASGSGQTSFMVTTARCDDTVDLYVIDTRHLSWDGKNGLTLLRAWDGHGMTGTQSHAFTLTNCEATRARSDIPFSNAISQVSQLSGVFFCAVITGILDEAFATTMQRLEPKRDQMRALEQVELVKAVNEHWQVQALYATARDAMGTPQGLAIARQAKYAIAGHAEQALARLSKVVGGSSFGRSSPLGQWAQDVKALGFLRPPWALQNDQLFAELWTDT